MISFLAKRRGATLAGMVSLALGGLVLLCGAGSAPIENFLPQGAMQGDLNAGGHNLTNAATVYATNVVVSGSLTAPSGFTLPFSSVTGTPTTLSGYGISDPIVLTSGSYANPSWLTSLAYAKLSGAPTLATVATSGAYNDLTGKPTIPAAQVNSDWNASSGVAQILNKPALGALAAVSPGGTASSSTFLKYDGTTFSYATPPGAMTSGSSLLYGNGSGGFSNATIGSGLAFSSGTLAANVTSVAGRSGAIVLTASDISGLATVATSGSYNDLSSKPTIPAAQVNSDWNASSGLAQILNKPALAASATTDTTNASNITSGTLAAARVATLNQNTTGSAGSFTGSLAGDVTGTQGATAVGKINGTAIPAANSTALGNPLGATNGLAQPVYPSPATGGVTLVTAGASIAAGLNCTTVAQADYANCFSHQLSLLPFFAGKLVSYTTSGTISGASAQNATFTPASMTGISLGQYMTGTGGTGTIPAGTVVQFVNSVAGTVTLQNPISGSFVNGTVTTAVFTNQINTGVGGAATSDSSSSGATTGTANWSGATNTITFTSAPTLPAGFGSSYPISGTNIPAGTYMSLLGGGTVATLNQNTTGSGSSVTVTIYGNDITGRYAAFVKPHRPTANGGDGGAVSYLLIADDNILNELLLTTVGSSIVSSLASYVSTAEADGFTVILQTVSPVGSSSSNYEIARNYVNDAIRSGGVAALGSGCILCDIADGTITDPFNRHVPFYYGDYVHWLKAGHTAVALYDNYVLQSGAPPPNASSRKFGEYVSFLKGIDLSPTESNSYNSNYAIQGDNFYVTLAGAGSFNGNIEAGLGGGNLQLDNYSGLFAWKGGSTIDTAFARTSGAAVEINNGTSGDMGTIRVSTVNAVGPAPTAPTLITSGTPGSTSYSYVVVGYDANGNRISASPVATINTGNATLSGSNSVYVRPPINGCPTFDIYRTAGGSSQGKITSGFNISNIQFQDSGLTGDGTTPPPVGVAGAVNTGTVNSSATQTTVSGSTAGSVTFSEPFAGASYKKVLIYCNAVTGTASYTFPAAFTNTPAVVTTSGPAASAVTALSTTALTVTGSGTTGPIVVEGY